MGDVLGTRLRNVLCYKHQKEIESMARIVTTIGKSEKVVAVEML
jgi:hypothetical protein